MGSYHISSIRRNEEPAKDISLRSHQTRLLANMFLTPAVSLLSYTHISFILKHIHTDLIIQKVSHSQRLPFIHQMVTFYTVIRNPLASERLPYHSCICHTPKSILIFFHLQIIKQKYRKL